jgi:hypothetical protein
MREHGMRHRALVAGRMGLLGDGGKPQHGPN